MCPCVDTEDDYEARDVSEVQKCVLGQGPRCAVSYPALKGGVSAAR